MAPRKRFGEWVGNSHMVIENENEDIEVKLLLEAIFLKYGFDFRGYSRLSVKRQILKIVKDEGLKNISELQYRLIWSESYFQNILPRFSISVTEHFRDPSFYKYFRDEIVPILETYPSLKIWHAGCATGQEVYSTAILLEEENLLERAQIYATDINPRALDVAKEGVYPEKELSLSAKNYSRAGGKKSFSEYIFAKGQKFTIKEKLRNNISFFDHNLVTDETFVEAHVILCRNVLIYFDEELIQRVVKLFHNSLHSHGFLCLGSKERIIGHDDEVNLKLIESNEKVYKKYPNALLNCAN